MGKFKIYNLSDFKEEENHPITQEEIERIKSKIKIGDRIKKKVLACGFDTKKQKERVYVCCVLEKCKHGVLKKL